MIRVLKEVKLSLLSRVKHGLAEVLRFFVALPLYLIMMPTDLIVPATVLAQDLQERFVILQNVLTLTLDSYTPVYSDCNNIDDAQKQMREKIERKAE